MTYEAEAELEANRVTHPPQVCRKNEDLEEELVNTAPSSGLVMVTNLGIRTRPS